MKRIVLDIGGTATKSAIFENGVLSDLKETPTDARLGGSHVTQLARSIIEDYQKQYLIQEIGISTAGQVHSKEGYIIYANQNIPDYTGTHLKEILEDCFHLPTAVENDVNCAALGEAHFGAGRGEPDFACLTYGTGIGGALFLQNVLYAGSSFSAGEFGAIITHPEAYHPKEDFYSGCYEKYASTTALVAKAKMLDPSLTNGRLIFQRFQDNAVKSLVDNWIQEILYGLVTIIHMLNPSCIILGGGIMEQPYILEKLNELLYQNLMPSFRNVSLKKASLGNQAGLLGAGVLSLHPL